MSYFDLITSFCRTPQAITTDVVSEHVISFPSDLAREVFVHSEHLVKLIVGTVAGAMASGLRVQFRFATNAALTGTPLVAGETRILLPAVLTANSVHFLRVNPIALPLGYDFAGLWFDLISEAATGLTFYAGLVEGPEKIDAVDAAP